MADTFAEAREARRAALLAKRADRQVSAESTVKVTDVLPGDFIVKVPSQEGIRGLTYDMAVRELRPIADAYRIIGKRGARVDGIAFVCADPRFVSCVWPETFDVVIRRVL